MFLPVPCENLSQWQKNSVFSNYSSRNLLYRLSYVLYTRFTILYWRKKKIVASSVTEEFVGIEIGGGESPSRSHLGYLNCDIRDLPSVDVTCHANNIQQHFSAASIDVIYARHFLEHLTWQEVDTFFMNCNSLLKDGGKIELIVPSLAFSIMQLIFHKKISIVFLHGLAGLNGWQRDQEKGGYWDIHKSSFTHGIINIIAKKYKFKLQFIRSQPKEIYFVMIKN